MNERESEYFNWLINTTNDYRGRFINQAISVEQIIDEFLSFYFVEKNVEKRFQFHQLILASIDMTFSQKILIFTEIVTNFLPAEFDEYKGYLPKIENLRHKRNEFAHSKVDSRHDSITKNCLVHGKLNLLKLKDFELKEIILDIPTLEKQLVEFGKLTENLAVLLNDYIELIENPLA